MTEITPVTEPRASKNFVKVAFLCLLIVFMLALMLTTISPVVWWFTHGVQPMPDGMEKWATLTLGVLLGSVFSMLREYMGFN